ncbi:hypothetical protein [Nocardioides terrisoli]|uniref:hypothetical protein n=1 Tax=Nocardioides terrisoli TaxID=3388267 RepID=UPI00287B7CEA|nr:hypothetical protein [Nocardioides marmorisolisilvae]
MTGVDHLLLVGPALDEWDTNPDLDWRKLLPDLPADHRDSSTAEVFCDALLRAYLLRIRNELRDLVAGLDPVHPQRAGLTSLIDAFEDQAAIPVMRWLRRACWRLGVGQSAATLSSATVGLVALAALIGNTWNISGLGPCWLSVTPRTPAGSDQVVHLLPLFAAEPKAGTAVMREIERRIQVARTDGTISSDSTIIAVCSGHVGSLGSQELPVSRDADLDAVLRLVTASAAADMPVSVVDEFGSDHLIDGTTARGVVAISAATVGIVE